MTFSTNNSPVGAGVGSVGSSVGSSAGSGSLSPSSSITNFNILSLHEWNSPTSSQTQRGSGNSSIFGSLNTIPNYDVELIVQTTKQEDARFMGKKKRRCSSVSKVFMGDFLQLSSNITILKMISKYGDNHILFSDVVIKVNKRNKMQERIIIITDRAIYNIQPIDYKLKRRISLINLTSLSLSTLEDNFIVIHVNTEYDYVLISGRKIEIATILVEAFYKQSIFNQMFPPQMLTLTTPSVVSPRDAPTGTAATTAAPGPLAMSMSHSPSALIPSPSMPSNNAPSNNSSSNTANGSTSGVVIGSHQGDNSLGGRNSNNGSRGGGNAPPASILSSLSTSFSTTSSHLLNSISTSFQQHTSNNSANNPGTNSVNVNSPNIHPTSNNLNGNSNNSSVVGNSGNNNNSPIVTGTPVISTTSPTQQPVGQLQFTDHLLTVNFTERIEYKIEGDSMREIIFTRVQGAVNIQIQTLKTSRQVIKKEHSRLSTK